jgi:hypothetical protein
VHASANTVVCVDSASPLVTARLRLESAGKRRKPRDGNSIYPQAVIRFGLRTGRCLHDHRCWKTHLLRLNSGRT